MVAKAKAQPKECSQLADVESWDSQTTGSCSEEEHSVAPGFGWETLMRYPTTAIINAEAKNKGKDMGALQMLYRSPSCKGHCRPNQEMILVPRQVSASFFVYKADIANIHRCSLSTDLRRPHCAGDACLPCYTAHMACRYRHSAAVHTKKVILMWHRLLQEPQFPPIPAQPPTCTQKPEHGHQERAAILENIKYLAAEIEGLPQEIGQLLATKGGIRMAREEVLSLAAHGLLLTVPGALRPTSVSVKMVQTTGGIDKGPLYSEAIAMMFPQNASPCTSWYRAVVDATAPYSNPGEMLATQAQCTITVNAILDSVIYAARDKWLREAHRL